MDAFKSKIEKFKNNIKILEYNNIECHYFINKSFFPNDNYILNMIKNVNAKYIYYENFDELIDSISNFIVQGKIIGWFQGRMEFGPRALGNRSILADPRASDMQMRLNISIKKR